MQSFDLDGFERKIRAMSPDDLLKFALEVGIENLRLRKIAVLSRIVGLSVGAITEFYINSSESNRVTFGVVVCRPDADERKFMLDMSRGIESLTKIVGGFLSDAEVTGSVRMMGEDASPPSGGLDAAAVPTDDTAKLVQSSAKIEQERDDLQRAVDRLRLERNRLEHLLMNHEGNAEYSPGSDEELAAAGVDPNRSCPCDARRCVEDRGR